jgi:hypothetical protein
MTFALRLFLRGLATLLATLVINKVHYYGIQTFRRKVKYCILRYTLDAFFRQLLPG